MNQAAERNPLGRPGDETDLIRAAQHGDGKAFAELVRRYQRAIYRVAYALTRNASDADDLAQETFVRAYQALGRFRLGEPIYPWLARICTNQAFTLFRRRRRRPETPLEPLVEAGMQWGADDDPARAAEEREGRQHLQRAFEKLSPEHRAVLTLRVVDDMPYESIAKTLTIPIGTVMSRLSRARAELKLHMKAETGESS